MKNHVVIEYAYSRSLCALAFKITLDKVDNLLAVIGILSAFLVQVYVLNDHLLTWIVYPFNCLKLFTWSPGIDPG
jgi:hypothetical protein